MLEEGFDDAEADVRDLVMAAVDVLAKAGADVSEGLHPRAPRRSATAQDALMGEGALALFKTGFFGAFTRTYYPASLIAAINQLWAAPRRRARAAHQAVADRRRAEPPQLPRPACTPRPRTCGPTYIKAYDAALADVDVLVMPTCLMTAPKNHRPGSYLEAVEDNLDCRRAAAAAATPSRSTTPATRRWPCPWASRRRVCPVSMQLVGRFFDDPLLLRVAYAYQHSVDWDKIISVDA